MAPGVGTPPASALPQQPDSGERASGPVTSVAASVGAYAEAFLGAWYAQHHAGSHPKLAGSDTRELVGTLQILSSNGRAPSGQWRPADQSAHHAVAQVLDGLLAGSLEAGPQTFRVALTDESREYLLAQAASLRGA